MTTESETELTPEAAIERIGQLQTDSNFTSKYINGDKASTQEMNRLHEIAYGKEPANLNTGDDIGLAEALTEALDQNTQDELLDKEVVQDTNRAQAHEFDLGWGGEMPEDAREFDAEIRTWLTDSGVSAGEGNQMIQSVNKIAEQYPNGISDNEADQLNRETMASLTRLWGNQTEARINAAQALLSDIDQKHGGKILSFISGHPEIGNNMEVIAFLASAAERQGYLK